MDAKTLVKQFGSDPGLAFLEVIRTAPNSIRATDVKREMIDAGASRADVDRQWKRLQPVLKLHPNVVMQSNRYGWAAVQRPAQNSLDVLAANLLAKVPAWLSQALVENVSRGLVDSADADSRWAGKEFEKARLVADLAMAVAALKADGGTVAEVQGLLDEELQRKRLWPIGRPGDSVPFDPESHETGGEEPSAGTAVKVVRSGYMWRGGAEPIVAARAVVAV